MILRVFLYDPTLIIFTGQKEAVVCNPDPLRNFLKIDYLTGVSLCTSLENSDPVLGAYREGRACLGEHL